MERVQNRPSGPVLPHQSACGQSEVGFDFLWVSGGSGLEQRPLGWFWFFWTTCWCSVGAVLDQRVIGVRLRPYSLSGVLHDLDQQVVSVQVDELLSEGHVPRDAGQLLQRVAAHAAVRALDALVKVVGTATLRSNAGHRDTGQRVPGSGSMSMQLRF